MKTIITLTLAALLCGSLHAQNMPIAADEVYHPIAQGQIPVAPEQTVVLPPVDLSSMTFEQLNALDEALFKLFLATPYSSAEYAQIERKLNLAGAELSKRNLATLQANDADIEGLTKKLQAASVEMDKWAHQKWCHQTLWRRIRGYREPQWCY